MNMPLLSLVTFLPTVGAAFIFLFLKEDREYAAQHARWAALWVTSITFVLSLALWIDFRPVDAGLPVRRAALDPGLRRSATTWASTASRCSSCCCPPS